MLPVTLLNSLKILTQPDDSTCGPTSLHAVYQYFQDTVPLEQVISEVSFLEEGGTLAVLLGCHALRRGYKAKIYTYNLHVFDPTWFKLKKEKLIANLREQLIYKSDAKLHVATHAYIEFLELGGEIRHKDLTFHLLDDYFSRGIPLLAGLSATYLYNCARERTNERGEAIYDDVRGEPLGHFVVLAGFDQEQEKEHVIVADPYQENPLFGNNYYNVPISRLINAIMLGIVTYDANLLAIEPQPKPTLNQEQTNLHAQTSSSQ
ncbi:peptidase-C39 like family protein [Rufibacter sediminis]|uniref:Peptidase-C39 like family protein n=1 Tax=Rufibacter sediminis TaxID=2762756 RepID=A0ABR6VRE3_9BACT|nr:peptidase-C39 like family protein [Rufibacter sediminis]MBC3539727.1 peptidase-C39 like family protein [Rufibacter sediminis]